MSTAAAEGSVAGRAVAVTGATGFLGAHVVEGLVAAGAAVQLVADDPGWREPGRSLVEAGRVTLTPAGSWWTEAGAHELAERIGDVDHLVHLAYRPPEDPVRAAVAEIEVNLLGTVRLLHAAADRVGHVVLAGSTRVHGGDHPVVVDEDHPAVPGTPYGAAKLALEQQLRLLAAGGPPSTVLRLATLYGPGETVPRAVPNFVRAGLRGEAAVINGPGTELVDLLFVRDAAARVLQAVQRPAGSGSRVLNAGSGTGTSTQEVAAAVADVIRTRGLGDPPPPRHGAGHARPDLVCDVRRLHEELGPAPATPLPEGLDEEVDFFAARPQLWQR